MRSVPHFIDGKAYRDQQEPMGDIFDPAAGTVQAQLGLGSEATLERAITAALRAQKEWAAVNPQRRARVMFNFKRLIEDNMQSLAELLSSEHGKVVADSKGDIQRGLEVVEFVCGVPHLMKGDYSEGAGPGIDIWSMRQPLGVVAGITPFNFPAMIPLWMMAPAIAAGNAFILKPSEKAPSVPIRLAELVQEAGLPDGVFNVVQGDRHAVEAILDHPSIKAVSFVGSSDIAQSVYARGAAAGKRVQAMGGAKNHGIVLPDADIERAAKDIIGAAYGAAGERCMALPVVVPVGEEAAMQLKAALLAEIAGLRVGIPSDPDADYGPVISAAHKARIEHYIQMGIDEGAELVVDGRGLSLQGHEQGFFLGPTLFDHVTPDMQSYRDEIFGPVLQIVRASSLDEAIDLATRHQYGNGVALFTRNGAAARQFASTVEVGMVGVNVPIPVPVAYHSFGGWKRSAFGDMNQYGEDSIRFFTRTKIVTQRWPENGAGGSGFIMPVLS